MGMFDYVNVEVPCPKCGGKVTNLQSKSAGCNLALLDPSAVDNFYASCDSCKEWVEFTREVPSKPARTEPFNSVEIQELAFELVDRTKKGLFE